MRRLLHIYVNNNPVVQLEVYLDTGEVDITFLEGQAKVNTALTLKDVKGDLSIVSGVYKDYHGNIMAPPSK